MGAREERKGKRLGKEKVGEGKNKGRGGMRLGEG